MSKRFIFSAHVNEPAQILGANYYDHWDYTDAATLSVTGTDINSCTSKGSNAAVMASTGTSRPKVLVGQINGYQVSDFDGINDFANVATSTAMYNFLHNTSGGTVIIISRVNDLNPNAIQTFLNNDDLVTSKRGFGLAYDDRASLSRNNTIRQLVSGVANLPALNATANNFFTTQQYNLLYTLFDSGNATAANRGAISINNGAEVKNNTNLDTPTALNASDNLTFGKGSTTNSFYFKGQVAEIIIANIVISTQQITELQNYYAFKYGTFPIL